VPREILRNTIQNYCKQVDFHKINLQLSNRPVCGDFHSSRSVQQLVNFYCSALPLGYSINVNTGSHTGSETKTVVGGDTLYIYILTKSEQLIALPISVSGHFDLNDT
jgi:hypothetical protein